MKIVLDNIGAEHFKWLTAMAKVLNFKVLDVELSEEEEDKTLLMIMETTKHETPVNQEEAADFRSWLKSVKA